MTSVLCIIGVRGGSKGVRNKNIRPMLGKPLLAHTIEQAEKCDFFEHIVVSTDSEEISAVARSFGAESWFLRPSYLATDNAPKIPVIRHALVEAEDKYNKKYDVLIDLDVTSPLRLVSDIKEAYKEFVRKDPDNLFSVCPSRKNPYFNMVEEIDKRIVLVKEVERAITCRQEAPRVYDINASIYIWKRHTILCSNSLYNDKTAIYIMPEIRSIDIDSEEDWKYVEYLMKEQGE